MRLFILGLLAGLVVNLAPLFLPDNAAEVYEEWFCSFDDIGSATHISRNDQLRDIRPDPIIKDSVIYLMSGNGSLRKKISLNDKLVSITDDGRYYALYEKIGTKVELLNADGERFWSIDSREYPYMSANGKIILLLNGDQSRVRIIDINGNFTGREIHGRLCTVIYLTENSDLAGIGFLDGSCYIVNEKGEIIKEEVISGSIIKGMALSDNGRFCAVHYGKSENDFVRISDLQSQDQYVLQLKYIHLTRTAIMCGDSGDTAIFDHDRIVLCHDNEIRNIIEVPAKKPGISSINYYNGYYSAGYTGIDNLPRFLVFSGTGDVIFARKFTQDEFLESHVYKNFILLRGSHNLYGYSLQIPGS